MTPTALNDYFGIRRAQRAARIAEKVAALTDRELALVREASVLGYVHGALSGSAAIPKDGVVVDRVLFDSDAFADLYPTLAGLGGDR